MLNPRILFSRICRNGYILEVSVDSVPIQNQHRCLIIRLCIRAACILEIALHEILFFTHKSTSVITTEMICGKMLK